MSAVLGSRQRSDSGRCEGFVYIVRGSVWQLWLLLSLCTSVSVCACACNVCSCVTDHEQLFIHCTCDIVM